MSSRFAFVAVCLLAVSSANGQCLSCLHPARPLHPPASIESAWAGGMASGVVSTPDNFRGLAAPQVELWPTATPELFATSTDAPPRLITVVYQPLTLTISWGHIADTLPRWIEIYVDGEVANHIDRGSFVGTQFEWSMPCPEPGRHVIQARCLFSNGLWTRVSAPIHVEIQKPAAPEIIAIADGNLPLRSGLSVVKGPVVQLTLAGVRDGTRAVVDLDGQPRVPTLVTGCSVYELSTANLMPGPHSISVRTVANCAGCNVTSDPSSTVTFLYEPAGRNTMWSSMPGGLLRRIQSAAPPQKMQGSMSQQRPNSSSDNMLLMAVQANPFRLVAHGGEEAPALGADRSATWFDRLSNSTLPDVTYFENVDDQNVRDEGLDFKSDFEWVFNDPAHFPLRNFGPRGEIMQREGAVIYEGMRLQANCSGRYQLSFVVECPTPPVSMRLQFLVTTAGGETYTLTAPPIRVPNDEDTQRGERMSYPYVVRLEGYSPVFEQQSIRSIRRTGSARFGFSTTLEERDRELGR